MDKLSVSIAIGATLHKGFERVMSTSVRDVDRLGNRFKDLEATTAKMKAFRALGEDLLEIDVVNMIEKIGGVDRLAAQRAALGM